VVPCSNEEERVASSQYETLIQALNQPMFPPDDPLEVAREKLEAVHGHAIAATTRVEHVTLAGVPCAQVTVPEAEDAAATLLLCHGGAYIAACGDGYLFYAEMLGRRCGAQVVLVDYRLAPEHRHPAAVDDCAEAYRGLLASGVPGSRIVFVGDSCGGGLAIGALLRLRESGEALPAGAVALGGWFDLAAPWQPQRTPHGPEPFLHPGFVRARGRDYAGPDGDTADPLASVVHADLTGLPPLLLQVGGVDGTRFDAFRLTENAARDGVDVTLEVHPEMIHGFQGLANGGLPEAESALARVSSWVEARLR
jgi:monoterpene epsilon-lactone hydrolase